MLLELVYLGESERGKLGINLGNAVWGSLQSIGWGMESWENIKGGNGRKASQQME